MSVIIWSTEQEPSIYNGLLEVILGVILGVLRVLSYLAELAAVVGVKVKQSFNFSHLAAAVSEVNNLIQTLPSEKSRSELHVVCMN